MIHREFKAEYHHGNSYEPRREPFDLDVQSVWQQDGEDKENKEKEGIMERHPVTTLYGTYI